MHHHAHQKFAMGIASLLAWCASLHLITSILVITIAGFIGILPDYDIIWHLPHRKITHHWVFIFIAALIITICLIIFLYAFQYIIQTDILTGIAYSSTTIDRLFTWHGFYILGILFVSGLSHLLLDVITPSGLDMGEGHYSGNIKSANPRANFFFETVGICFTLSGIVGLFGVNYFGVISPFYIFQILYFIIGIVLLVFVLALRKKTTSQVTNLYCGSYDGLYGKIELCSDRPCVDIGGERICFKEPEKVPDNIFDDELI